MIRRFSRLRARLLLLKQDQLSLLEQRLDQVDRDETSVLFLGQSRSERNPERVSLLSEIDASLKDYDQFAERTHRVLSFDSARPRDIESLQNWLHGTGCLARKETEYLTHHQELASLAATGDSAILELEAWVEDKLIRFSRRFRERRFHDASTDRNVYTYSGPLVQRTAKTLLLFLITLLLLMPVVVCNVVSATSIRIIIVMSSTISYLAILARLTKARTIELILAGATYATVLIVFVSGTSGLSN